MADTIRLLTPEMLAWVGRSEAPLTVEVSRREIVKYAIATEQQQAKFLQGDEAPPMFLFGLFRALVPVSDLGTDGLPAIIDGPQLPVRRIMAGGVQIRQHQPIRPGQTLVGTRALTDMTEKMGRQGPVIFMVYELAVKTDGGDPVVDEIQTRIAL